MKCLWINRVCNEFHHDWKKVSLDCINNALVKNFKFHSNLSIPNKTINSLPSYYKGIINSWCKYYYTPEVQSIYQN